MTDLLQTARLFDVSSRLSEASVGMSRLADRCELSAADLKTFKWAGRLLGQMDRLSGLSPEPGPEGSLAVEATTTRPTFYAALVQIAPEFDRAGIHQESEVYKLLREISGLLVSGGEKSEEIPEEHIRVGAKLLHVLSNGLLVRLTNNGVPKTPTTLTYSGIA